MSGELVVSEPQSQPPIRHADTYGAVMATPSQLLPAKLEEFDARRDTFRAWLLAKFERGVHFGVCPGTGGKGKEDPEYKKLPSLYQPGADLVIEVMNVRAQFDPDAIAWQQLGSKSGTYVYKCRLYSRDGELLGEGIGAARVGDKSHDENGAAKKACKRAKVAAVIVTYSLSDLFTQDLEDGVGKQPGEAPVHNQDAPTSPTREQEVKPEQFAELSRRWRHVQAENERPADKSEWEIWVNAVTGMSIPKLRKQNNWTVADFGKCMRELGASR